MIRKTLTILFTDVQGYTSRTGRQTRQQHELFIIELQSFIKKQTKEKNGNFVKSMGDGFMLTFESPTDAVACGISIQKQISLSSASIRKQEKPILFRIGVSTGEVMVDDNGDVYGDAVNIASRIEAFAIPGEVYISEATYLAMNKSEFNAIDLGPQKFKNVRHEISVYRVFEGNADVISSLQRPISKKHINAFIAIIAVIGIGLLIVFFSQKRSSNPARTSESDIHAQFEHMLQNKDFQGIIEKADKMLLDDPNSGYLYALTGEAFMQLGDLLRAETYLTKAIALEPENPGPYYLLSDLNSKKKEFDQAILFLAEYLRREQNPIEKKVAIKRMQELENLKSEYFNRFDQLSDENQFLVQDTLQSLEEPVSEETDNLTESPITEQENIDLKQSREFQQESPIRQKNNRDKLQAIRAQLKEFMLDDDYQSARHILQTAEEDNLDNSAFLIFASKLYLKMDDYGKSEELLMRALDLNPDNPTPYFGLSLIYKEREDYKESIKMLEEFIYRDKNDIRRKKTEEKIELLRDKMEKSQ